MKTICIGIVVVLICALVAKAAPPNIVVILADD